MIVDQKKFWTAFYTKSRNEKKASERLAVKGYDVFCPTRTVMKQWSDRKKKVKEPLFTSYLFAKVDELQRQEICRDQGVVCSVFWEGEPVKIRELEIKAIVDFLDENPEAEGLTDNFSEGEKIEIVQGPFKGEQGELLTIKGSKLVLSIDSIGFSLVAEVARSKVKLAS